MSQVVAYNSLHLQNAHAYFLKRLHLPPGSVRLKSADLSLACICIEIGLCLLAINNSESDE